MINNIATNTAPIPDPQAMVLDTDGHLTCGPEDMRVLVPGPLCCLDWKCRELLIFDPKLWRSLSALRCSKCGAVYGGTSA